MTKRIAVLAVLSILTACGPDEREDPVASTDPPSYGPGGTVDLNATFGALIGGTGTGVAWAVGGASAAVSAGLRVTPEGLLVLPDCRFIDYGGHFPTTISLEARSGSASGPVLLSISIVVDEKFISSTLACYILSTESLCRDPASATGLILETGGTVQFYSRVRTTCSTNWSPALPAGAPCPANDPAYAFCQN